MFTNSHLLRPMDEQISVTGDPVRAAGWFGHTDGLHTFSIGVQNFVGRIKIQGALATTPGDADWFTLLPNSGVYLQYPQNGYVVTSPATGETSTYGFSFTAALVWVRAIVDRSYFLPAITTPQHVGTYGLVDHILMRFGNNLGQYDRQWSAAGWVPGRG